MAVLEFIRTYLDDILLISKASLDDHQEKLRMVFIGLQEAKLKIYANKSKFCALETEYLGYTLSKEGMKTETKRYKQFLR